MASQAEPTSPPGTPQQQRVRDDRDAFAEMFDAHAQHLFDYCCCLLGDRARAASATQVTLIAAHSLADRLDDAGRMRAFVLALGRWECLTGGPGLLAGSAGTDAAKPDDSDELATALAFADQADDDVGDADTGEFARADSRDPAGLSLRAIRQELSRDDREILDLLYRHEVSITDLARLLGVPAASVPGMVGAAEATFAARASDTDRQAAADSADLADSADSAGPAPQDVRAEQLSAVRLVSLPASVWRRTARVVMDPRFRSYREAVRAHAEHLGPDGFPVQAVATPSNRKLLMASVLMAGLLLAPAAAGGAVYAAVSTLAHVVDHHHSPAVTPGSPASGGSAAGASGVGRGHSGGGAKRAGSGAKGRLAGNSLAPQPRQSATRPARHKPSPTASPVPTSRYSSPSSPWPSQSPTSTGNPSQSPTQTPSTSPSSSAGAANPA